MAATESRISQRLQHIKKIILVLSGKGGVGKSSISTQLALTLYNSSPNARVGILDIDLTGPSIPRMLGLAGHPVYQSTDGWVPVYADGAERRLGCMSVGFLLKNPGDSVVWRGPKKNGMIRQFLADVRWGELDYLIIDTPPGTSDEHLSLIEHLSPIHPNKPNKPNKPKLSSIIVTTPQAVALTDALKCLSFARTVNLPVLGLIENMSGFVCPCCGERSDVFSTGGGQAMALREGLAFLGSLPVDTELVALLDATPMSGDGGSDNEVSSPSFELMVRYNATPSSKLFKLVLDKIQESNVGIE
ncbi:P-loop containing nucleoside triphosphate hydrolase protein [Lentinula raphanica]|nr:P-loop containing nucleoside triphosphate hydrolase protein [Lentinula raphanica]